MPKTCKAVSEAEGKKVYIYTLFSEQILSATVGYMNVSSHSHPQMLQVTSA
jgi:hypothetical protein